MPASKPVSPTPTVPVRKQPTIVSVVIVELVAYSLVPTRTKGDLIPFHPVGNGVVGCAHAVTHVVKAGPISPVAVAHTLPRVGVVLLVPHLQRPGTKVWEGAVPTTLLSLPCHRGDGACCSANSEEIATVSQP